MCDTEEQWVSLAESIKDKSSPQDRHLYRIISQNFLPEISSMIEHKVRGWRVENGATALILCDSGVNNAECQLKITIEKKQKKNIKPVCVMYRSK